MDKRKILESKVPYIALFGVDGMGKGRPANDTAAAELLPTLGLPLMVDQGTAMKIRSQARTRAMTVLKTVFAKEFVSIYEKEVLHLVSVHEAEARMSKAGSPDDGSGFSVGGVASSTATGDPGSVAAGMVAERESTVEP